MSKIAKTRMTKNRKLLLMATQLFKLKILTNQTANSQTRSKMTPKKIKRASRKIIKRHLLRV